MPSIFTKIALIVIFTMLTSWGHARDFIRIVGSSTVYPFASLMAERFSTSGTYPSPIVEVNGTGGGFAQFCKGIGYSFPDINNASRPITEQELALCTKNGVQEPLSIKIGFDGITVIYPKSLGKINLTTRELFLALSYKVPSKEDPNIWVDNFYYNWSDINPNLPNTPIKIIGPPSTSGTRDTFTEIILGDTCKIVANRQLDSKEEKELCKRIRRDNVWLDGSENFNLVLQKVTQSNATFAILGYNYYQANGNTVGAADINNVSPTHANISNGRYALSRPLYMYVKTTHMRAVPGLKDFVEFIISPNTLGENGFLTSHGLVPLTPVDYQELVHKINESINN